MRRAVLDASVVLKWYLVDEEYGQKALELLSRYVSNELEILAPSLLEYEVVNGLFIAQKKGRIKDVSDLAIAHVEGVPMITSDERLFKAIKKDLKWVKWLGDISLAENKG